MQETFKEHAAAHKLATVAVDVVIYACVCDCAQWRAALFNQYILRVGLLATQQLRHDLHVLIYNSI